MTADPSNVTPQSADAQDETVPLGLRILVIVLGVAIFIMIILIVGTIIKRSFDDKETGVSAQADPDSLLSVTSNNPGSNAALLDISVERPAGAQLVYSQIVGREFLLHFKLAEGGDMIMAVDRFTGTVRRLHVLADGSRP